MSYVLTAPDMLATAASDMESIGSALSTAATDAAGPTTDLAAAAEDEVSAAVARLFGAFAQEYQAVIAKAAAFHSEFTQALTAAANAYAHAEATATALVSNASSDPVTALIMGGTDNPQPNPGYVTSVFNSYVNSRFPGATPQGLFTPEQFFPATPQLGNLTLGQSVTQGVTLLNDALVGPTGVLTQGHSAVVAGFSQSTLIETDEIRALLALPAAQQPSSSQLSFILLGDPVNPDGGLLTRFPGYYIDLLDAPFTGATPQSPWPTAVYTIQYEGGADFPQYPLNVVSDLNATLGGILHPDYPFLTATQVANAVPLPTSGGNTEYFMVLTQNLPLLDPIRLIPFVGNPIADLLQPDLRVIVDLGYAGFGPGADFANIPTPAELFSVPNPFVVIPDLATGAVQGVQAALVDLGVLPTSALPNAYPYLPSIDPQLHFYFGQPSTTILSILSETLGNVFRLHLPILGLTG